MKIIIQHCALFLILLLSLSVNAKRSNEYIYYYDKPQKKYDCPQCNKNDHHVKPHFKKNGNYVPGHMKTDRNERRDDNFTHRKNINPYTGKKGNKN